jgi:predicted PurR-regulated permease PerM
MESSLMPFCRWLQATPWARDVRTSLWVYPFIQLIHFSGLSLWLGTNGHWGKAVLMVAICGGVAGVADNLVRPLLMRNRTRLNDLLLFISILGGLEVFGLLGLVAGPTILAAALGVFRVYMEHRDRLEKESA